MSIKKLRKPSLLLGVVFGTVDCDKGSENENYARVHRVHKALVASLSTQKVSNLIYSWALRLAPWAATGAAKMDMMHAYTVSTKSL